MSHYAQALNASARFLDHRPGALARLALMVVLALRVRRERRQLAALDDAQLADLGLTRADAERESRRGLLDIPAHRKGSLYL